VLGFRERSDEAMAQFPAPTYRFYSTNEIAGLLADADLASSEMRTSTAGPGLQIAVARAEADPQSAAARCRMWSRRLTRALHEIERTGRLETTAGNVAGLRC